MSLSDKQLPTGVVAALVSVLVSGMLTAWFTQSNAGTASQLSIARTDVVQVQHTAEIADIKAELHGERRDLERILIVVTELARSQGLDVPARSKVP